MKLGATYNLFDSEELLESSIQSLRSEVDYVVVVYQLVSNWGNKSNNPHLELFLKELQSRGIVNELVFYEAKEYSLQEKKAMVSSKITDKDLGGPVDSVADVFFNELAKREIGRKMCKQNGCTHFISMDSDEYYKINELKYAKQKILENDYDATACRMRIFFKKPVYELCPPDDVNAVPLIYKIQEESEFRLAEPYSVICDPTRKLNNVKKFYMFGRSEIEMYHMSFVRKNMRSKLENVSNKANYANTEDFLKRFDTWTPDQGVLHPHPYIGRLFKDIRTVENFFNIDIDAQCRLCCRSQNLKRCSKCKQVRYCSVECQKEDFPKHKLTCKPNSL